MNKADLIDLLCSIGKIGICLVLSGALMIAALEIFKLIQN